MSHERSPARRTRSVVRRRSPRGSLPHMPAGLGAGHTENARVRRGHTDRAIGATLDECRLQLFLGHHDPGIDHNIHRALEAESYVERLQRLSSANREGYAAEVVAALSMKQGVAGHLHRQPRRRATQRRTHRPLINFHHAKKTTAASGRPSVYLGLNPYITSVR